MTRNTRAKLSRILFGAAVALSSAWLPACVANPLDPMPASCCDAACVASAGSFSFVSEGQPAPIIGRVSVTDLATGDTLLTQPMDGEEGLTAFLGNFELQAYEGGTADLRVDVFGEGFEDTSQEVTIEVQRTQICCDSCSTSNDSFEIELVPVSN